MAQIRIFLSYTRADEAQVKQLYHKLKAEGFSPWMDTEDLLPGQKFEYHIRQAIRDSDFFLACLSCNSVNRRGVIQREINEALDVLQEKLDEDIYLIPVRLEACDVPERLRAFHWADLHTDNGFDKLLRAIQAGIESQNRELPRASEGQVKSINAETMPKEWTEPATGMEFVWIPPGRFMMGQTEAEKNWLIKEVGKENYKKWFARELPRHEAQIREGFWLGKYPVTNAEYRLFKKEHDSQSYRGHALNGDRQPVVNVSWEDVTEFTEWLTQQSGDQHTFRLPSEAEWEYACRAGTETIFSWGNDPGEAYCYANGADQSFRKAFPELAKEYEEKYALKVLDSDTGYAVTSPVGSFQPNNWGLYDMLGNVWEWCLDSWFDNYNDGPINECMRGILDDKKAKVLRGGSWSDGAWVLRCAYRNGCTVDGRLYLGGCRVVACGSGARTLR